MDGCADAALHVACHQHGGSAAVDDEHDVDGDRDRVRHGADARTPTWPCDALPMRARTVSTSSSAGPARPLVRPGSRRRHRRPAPRPPDLTDP
ncbi:hypothetical protein TOK_4312 [Pseudonocardia sp. N23]|nr:hypothetical protein TOK_4312 [Pseudonocardia sp. N23]